MAYSFARSCELRSKWAPVGTPSECAIARHSPLVPLQTHLHVGPRQALEVGQKEIQKEKEDAGESQAGKSHQVEDDLEVEIEYVFRPPKEVGLAHGPTASRGMAFGLRQPRAIAPPLCVRVWLAANNLRTRSQVLDLIEAQAAAAANGNDENGMDVDGVQKRSVPPLPPRTHIAPRPMMIWASGFHGPSAGPSDEDGELAGFRDIFAKYYKGLLGMDDDEAAAGDGKAGAGEGGDSAGSDGEGKDGAGDGGRPSKKKQKLETRMTITELKQRSSRPETVEIWDPTAPDPLTLVHLKAYRNSVAVPRHWCQKRKYLQGKRGIEKPAFRLPDFIEKTGIGALRASYLEKEEGKKSKQKARERVRPKMNRYGALPPPLCTRACLLCPRRALNESPIVSAWQA